jgi:hypothetical protein
MKNNVVYANSYRYKISVTTIIRTISGLKQNHVGMSV